MSRHAVSLWPLHTEDGGGNSGLLLVVTPGFFCATVLLLIDTGCRVTVTGGLTEQRTVQTDEG